MPHPCTSLFACFKHCLLPTGGIPLLPTAVQNESTFPYWSVLSHSSSEVREPLEVVLDHLYSGRARVHQCALAGVQSIGGGGGIPFLTFGPLSFLARHASVQVNRAAPKERSPMLLFCLPSKPECWWWFMLEMREKGGM